MPRKTIPNLFKKTVSFVRYYIFGNILKDEAEVNGTTESAMIEQHLISDILPQNKEAFDIVVMSLYPANGEGDIGDTLTSLFRNNSAGINWGSKHSNFKPLVEYAHKILAFSNASLLTGEEEIIYHMKSQLDSLVQMLKELSEKTDDDTLTKTNYTSGYRFASELYKELDEHPQGFNVLNLFILVLEHWDDFKGWTRTYRLLGDAASVCQWPNTPQYKLDLLYLIIKISDEWSDDTVDNITAIPKKSYTKNISELKQDKKEELLKFIHSISSQDLNYIVSVANSNTMSIGQDSYVDYDAVIKEIESW